MATYSWHCVLFALLSVLPGKNKGLKRFLACFDPLEWGNGATRAPVSTAYLLISQEFCNVKKMSWKVHETRNSAV